MSDYYERRPMTDPAQIRAFALAGRAYLTLVSKKTGARFTYEIKEPPQLEGEPPSAVSHLIGVLTDSNNEGRYSYFGHIYRKDGFYTYGKKAQIGEDAPSVKAFRWFYREVIEGQRWPAEQLEVWHEGRCGKCGRKLTVPESIARGIGPECWRQSGGGDQK